MTYHLLFTYIHTYIHKTTYLFIVTLFFLYLISAPATAGWQIETVDPGGTMEGVNSLAFHPLSGNPAISYYDLGNSVLKFASFNGATWNIALVDSIDTASLREEHGETSLAFDEVGNPAIAYSDDGYPHHGILKFAYLNGPSCPTTVNPPTGCVGEDCPLAFNPVSGNPAISYVEDADNGDCVENLKYAYCNGTTWDITTVESVADDSLDENPSLAFDSSGNPAIAYVGDEVEGDSGTVKYAHFNGATWDITPVDSVVGMGIEYPSLAFDSSGNPAIAYEKNGIVKYAHFNGTTWDITPIDAGGGSSLAFDALGDPAIAYHEEIIEEFDYKLKYAHFNGTTWVMTPIDAGGGPSLAFDADGNPAISYVSNDRNLKLARFVQCTDTKYSRGTSFIRFNHRRASKDTALMRLCVNESFCNALKAGPEEIILTLGGCQPVHIPDTELMSNRSKTRFWARSSTYNLTVDCTQGWLIFSLKNKNLKVCVSNPVNACVFIEDGPCICAEEIFVERKDRLGRPISLTLNVTEACSP